MDEQFRRISRLPPYVFNIIGDLKQQARAAGEDIIDFGMGNPDQPTPGHIVEKLVETAQRGDTQRPGGLPVPADLGPGAADPPVLRPHGGHGRALHRGAGWCWPGLRGAVYLRLPGVVIADTGRPGGRCIASAG